MKHSRKVNIAESLARFDDLWSPKIVGECNDTPSV